METPYHAKVAAGAISSSSKRREGDDGWEGFTGRKQRQHMTEYHPAEVTHKPEVAA